jgi:hypothetical protein
LGHCRKGQGRGLFSRRENIADIGKSVPAFYLSFSFIPFRFVCHADQPASFAKASQPATPTLKFSRRENLGVDSRNGKPFLGLAQPSTWGIAG